MWSNTYLSFTVGFPYLLWKVTLRTSSRGGGIGKHCSPTSTIPPKITTKLKNNYHSKLSENQAVWKSDNHGTEEVTFIQMDKRGRDAKWVVHTRVWWIKIGKVISGASNPQQTRSPSPGFQWQEGESPYRVNIKPVGVGVAEETAGFSGTSS